MADMTPKQRLLATIRHEEPDRVPVSPRMHLWSYEQYGDHDWLRQLDLQEEFDLDPLIEFRPKGRGYYINHPLSGDYRELDGVSVELAVENMGEVSRVRRLIHTPAGDLSDVIDLPHRRSGYGLSPSPVRRESLVKGPEDADRIRFLLPDVSRGPGPNLRRVIEAVGERGLVKVLTGGATSITRALGMENTMLLFYDDRELFDRLLDVFVEQHLRRTKRMLELGAPVIYHSWHDFGTSAGWSPRIYREAFKPIVEASIELVHSYEALYFYFDNGPIQSLLSDLAEMEVDIVSTLCPPPLGDVDLSEAKRLIGDSVCLHGNVDAISVVQTGTASQVRDAVREAIRVAGPHGGFILGNSDCFFGGTSRENVQAFVGAAREFGRYPLRI